MPADQRMRSERGGGLIEYALLLLLISVVAVVAIALTGGKTSDLMDTVGPAFGNDRVVATTSTTEAVVPANAGSQPGRPWECVNPQGFTIPNCTPGSAP